MMTFDSQQFHMLGHTEQKTEEMQRDILLNTDMSDTSSHLYFWFQKHLPVEYLHPKLSRMIHEKAFTIYYTVMNEQEGSVVKYNLCINTFISAFLSLPPNSA